MNKVSAISATASCQYNEGVACPVANRNCKRCGHNPDVAKARMQKYREARSPKVPYVTVKTDEKPTSKSRLL